MSLNSCHEVEEGDNHPLIRVSERSFLITCINLCSSRCFCTNENSYQLIIREVDSIPPPLRGCFTGLTATPRRPLTNSCARLPRRPATTSSHVRASLDLSSPPHLTEHLPATRPSPLCKAKSLGKAVHAWRKGLLPLGVEGMLYISEWLGDGARPRIGARCDRLRRFGALVP